MQVLLWDCLRQITEIYSYSPQRLKWGPHFTSMWLLFSCFLSALSCTGCHVLRIWIPWYFLRDKSEWSPSKSKWRWVIQNSSGFLPLFFGHLNLWIHWNSLLSRICWIWGHNRCDPKIKGCKEFGQGRCSLHPDVRTLHDSLSKGSFVCPTINSHFLCIKEACTVDLFQTHWRLHQD